MVAVHINANGPPWGRALASAGSVVYAGNYRVMPCTISLSRLNQWWQCIQGSNEPTTQMTIIMMLIIIITITIIIIIIVVIIIISIIIIIIIIIIVSEPTTNIMSWSGSSVT